MMIPIKLHNFKLLKMPKLLKFKVSRGGDIFKF